MIDHISVRVQDFSKSVDFYKAALAPLGYELLMEFPGTAGLGVGGKPDLWIMESPEGVKPTHVAISGERPQIHAFHAAALAAGGTDNGLPGPRPDYHPHYYAAFVRDLDGNNIEVVCHTPEGTVAAKKPPARAAKRSARPAAKVAAKKSAGASAKVKKAAKAVRKAVAKVVGKAVARKPGKAAAKKRR